MTTRIDLDDLESKAKAATPGNWTTVAAVAPRQCVWTDHQGGIAPEANRQHIAAASPAVVLALIARIRELEQGIRDCDECRGWAPWQALMELIEKGTVLP